MTILNWAWAGVGVLAGVVIAGMTLAPGMAAVNDGLTCVASKCDDLAAQRSMAVAAWAMVGATVLSVLLAAGTVALVYTTYQASKRSADAAEAQAIISEDMGRRQVRAYLSVAGVVLDLDRSMPYAIVVHIKNTGKTPARNITLSLRLEIARNTTLATPAVQTLPLVFDYLAPETTEPIELHFMHDDFSHDMMSLIRVDVEGSIKYEDVFSKEDETVVWYRRVKPEFAREAHALYRADTHRAG